MAAIRCAVAGRALLRRSPGVLRRAAGVGERGLLQQHPMGALSSLSSNRYMSTRYFEIKEHEKKDLAVSLMRERCAYLEIWNMDEMLDLINSATDRHRYTLDKEFVSDPCRQQEAARTALEEKKFELVSALLRPDADGKNEYKKKMEEFVVAARLHRQSLLLEKLRKQNAKIIAGMVLLGIPVTMLALEKLQLMCL